MASFLTDKSLEQEARFGGWALAKRRAFAEPGTEPSYTPDRACKIEHIALDLSIDPVARTMVGSARIRLSPLPGQDGWYALDLDELTVDAVETPAGAPHPWRHADGKLHLAPTTEVIVRWHGSPRRGLWFVGPTAAEPNRVPEAWTQCQDEDGHFLFPCFDHPSVKHPWSLRVTAPAGYGVLSNGRLVERDGQTWMWDQAEPMPAYLVTVVVMKMDIHEDAWDGIPVRYAVPAGTSSALVERTFARTPAMVAHLSAIYGRYPWPRYDQVVVHDFIFGGMENVAATTLTDLVLMDEVAAMDGDMDDLIVHELAHQWFGDLLTCQDWSQGWLNEGWATYTEHLWSRVDKGVDASDWHLFEQMGTYLGEDGGRYRRPIVSYHFKSPIDLFDRHLYEKAALVIHTLRHQLGDTAFWAGVHLYLERHRHGTVHTRHFQRAMEDATGKNLDRFFATWIHGSGHPALTVSVAHADDQLTVTVKQTQEGDGVAPVFHVPLVVAFGDNRVTLKLDARERTFVLPCPSEAGQGGPAFVRIDPDFQLLAEIKVEAPRSQLVAALTANPNVVGRVRVARALAAEGSTAAFEALAAALVADPFWGVRAEIADLLAARGGDVAAAALLGALGDTSPKARRRIVAALGSVRRPEVGEALAALPKDPSAQVEGEVARSLGKLRAPAARAVCEALLTRESWGEVLRARGIEGLGNLRDASVLDALLAQSRDDAPARARAAACAALAKLGDEVDTTRTAVLERLVELAEDGNFRVQVSALNALGALRDPRSLPVLTRVHSSGGDGRSRRLAFEALANVREGRTSAEGLSTLRGQVESFVEENRKLRDRVGKLEAR
ncbi:MAG: M1 family aminopeptidase [Myxococcota bacterium]